MEKQIFLSLYKYKYDYEPQKIYKYEQWKSEIRKRLAFG